MIAIKGIISRMAGRMSRALKKFRIGITFPLLIPLPFATGTSSIGSTIFSGLWSVILSLFKSISSGLGGMFQQMMSGFGQNYLRNGKVIEFSQSEIALHIDGVGISGNIVFCCGREIKGCGAIDLAKGNRS